MRAWLLGLLLLAGCGYSTGFVLPEAEATVGVEFFGNESPLRNLEADLHGYLTDSVSRLVHARLVAPDDADYVIRGTVRDFRRRKGIRSPDNVRFETGVRITARAQLLKRGAPEDAQALDLVYDSRFTTQSGYLLEDPHGEADAIDRVLRNLADEVVLEMFSQLALQPAP